MQHRLMGLTKGVWLLGGFRVLETNIHCVCLAELWGTSWDQELKCPRDVGASQCTEAA